MQHFCICSIHCRPNQSAGSITTEFAWKPIDICKKAYEEVHGLGETMPPIGPCSSISEEHVCCFE